MKIYRKIYFVIIFFIITSPYIGLSQTKKTPWNVRHFPNAPRITAENAMQLKLSGQKVILIDVPWSKQGFNKGHICGAIPTKVDADRLDRLIKKIPKDYIILSY